MESIEKLQRYRLSELSDEAIIIVNKAINSGEKYSLRKTSFDGMKKHINAIIIKLKIEKGFTTIFYKEITDD